MHVGNHGIMSRLSTCSLVSAFNGCPSHFFDGQARFYGRWHCRGSFHESGSEMSASDHLVVWGCSTEMELSTDLKRINLGCGTKRIPGFVGVDIFEHPAVDCKMDALEYVRSLPDNSVSEVISRHFLEHLAPDVLRNLFLEIDRVLIPGGKIHLTVPHFSNPYFHSDPTHRQQFGVHYFSYLCEKSCFTRIVPDYATIPGWHLTKVRVGFRPYARLKLMGWTLPMPSDILNRVVNFRTLGIALFERYFSGVCSIYEVEFWIEKKPEMKTM